MPEWEWQAAALSQLLDVQIYSADGDPVGIRLRETARGLGIHRTTDWARDNIVKAIPGGSR